MGDFLGSVVSYAASWSVRMDCSQSLEAGVLGDVQRTDTFSGSTPMGSKPQLMFDISLQKKEKGDAVGRTVAHLNCLYPDRQPTFVRKDRWQT